MSRMPRVDDPVLATQVVGWVITVQRLPQRAPNRFDHA